MKINIDFDGWQSYLSGFASCFLLILSISFVFFGVYRQEPIPVMELSRSVAGTGSMLPSVTPDTMLDTIKFKGNMKCGHAYIYSKNDTNTVVHRFVYEDAEGLLYFKGDNNQYWDDPINLSQIEEEVVGYRWD